MANAGEKRKLNIEPITAVFMVVLLVACAALAAVSVEGKIAGEKDEYVSYGNTVVVDYTGSLYCYYDQSTAEKKAVIFDTTVKSVGDNSSYLFTSTFSKSSYSTASVTIGAGKYLADFENALIGAKVGDTIKVCISGENAYVAPTTYKDTIDTTLSFVNNFTMTATDFITYYGESLSSNGMIEFTYKDIPMRAVRDGTNVAVTYDVKAGDEFTFYDGELGKVIMTITDASTSNVTYTLKVTGLKTGEQIADDSHTFDQIETIGIDVTPTAHVNVVGVDSSDNVAYTVGKGTSGSTDPAIYNQDLYFVIKVISKS